MPFHDGRAIDDSALAGGRLGSAQVTSEPRKFGLFRNAVKTMVHPAGTTIFQEGEQGQSMFAIKRGRVAIIVSAVTLEETELVEIDESQFYLFVRQNPHFALQLMQLLSERLRRADALYRRPPGQ